MSKTDEISNSRARAKWQGEVDLGFYDERIKVYLKIFNSSQFHFVDGENIIKRPWVEVEKIEEFLGVEKIVSKKLINTIKKFALRFQNTLGKGWKCT